MFRMFRNVHVYRNGRNPDKIGIVSFSRTSRAEKSCNLFISEIREIAEIAELACEILFIFFVLLILSFTLYTRFTPFTLLFLFSKFPFLNTNI